MPHYMRHQEGSEDTPTVSNKPKITFQNAFFKNLQNFLALKLANAFRFCSQDCSRGRQHLFKILAAASNILSNLSFQQSHKNISKLCILNGM